MPRCGLSHVLAIIVIAVSAIGRPLNAQDVGDRVVMESPNPAGVPVHPAAGDPAFVRWANGTIGRVVEIDPATQWRRVESNGLFGWIVRTYLRVLPPDPTPADPADPALELPTYVVGAWNLEWLHDNRRRGFPENTRGGPSFDPRVEDDYRMIAETIRDRLAARLMVLSEVNGADSVRSVELDRLIGKLGAGWNYYLAPSGGQQRLALLWDERAVRRDTCIEVVIPFRRVQNKDIFDRDPLVCAFTFLDSTGQTKNDLLVVGVHLASGQNLVENHTVAMAELVTRLRTLMTNGTLAAGERDVLVAGDFNASRYDNHLETFWTDLDPQGFRFRTLSPDDGEEYPGTRLAGVPLAPTSKIDYLMASGRAGGLVDELAEPVARVRVDLLPTDFTIFRRHLSDHIPVTIRLRIVDDDDALPPPSA